MAHFVASELSQRRNGCNCERRNAERQANTRHSVRLMLLLSQILLVAGATSNAISHQTSSNDDATASQLAMDVKAHITAQLRAGHFDVDKLATELKDGYVKLKASGRRQSQNTTEAEDSITVSDFQCTNCLFEEDGFTERPIVAMYMSDERACNNIIAAKLLKINGLTLDACNYVKTAIPECFVAKNWDTGWMCQVPLHTPK